jgi:hypothetical protein
MKQDRINVLYVVVDYVKDLFVGRAVVTEKRDINMDAMALKYLSAGNIFYTNARNGREYLYCFVPDKANISVARHILRANNINPNLHVSRYYRTPMFVLRTPVKAIAENDKSQRFADKLMVERKNAILSKGIEDYVAQIKQNIK